MAFHWKSRRKRHYYHPLRYLPLKRRFHERQTYRTVPNLLNRSSRFPEFYVFYANHQRQHSQVASMVRRSVTERAYPVAHPLSPVNPSFREPPALSIVPVPPMTLYTPWGTPSETTYRTSCTQSLRLRIVSSMVVSHHIVSSLSGSGRKPGQCVFGCCRI